jgi:hypothetical protein
MCAGLRARVIRGNYGALRRIRADADTNQGAGSGRHPDVTAASGRQARPMRTTTSRVNEVEIP